MFNSQLFPCSFVFFFVCLAFSVHSCCSLLVCLSLLIVVCDLACPCARSWLVQSEKLELSTLRALSAKKFGLINSSKTTLKLVCTSALFPSQRFLLFEVALTSLERSEERESKCLEHGTYPQKETTPQSTSIHPEAQDGLTTNSQFKFTFNQLQD